MLLALLLAFRLWAPYRELCEKLHLGKLASSSEAEHDRVKPRLVLKPDSGNPKPITLLLKTKAGDVVLEQDAQGATELPLRRDLWDENPTVETSMPQGESTHVSLDFAPLLPPGLSFSSSELFKPVEQANHFIREEAGFLSFAAPKMKGIKLRFGRPSAIHVGERALPTGANDSIELFSEDGVFEHGATITLPEPPLAVDFIE